MNQIYAGIGSRETPVDVCEAMSTIAHGLSNRGWRLRSGHADRADYAFEQGATAGEIHLPWASYNRQLGWMPGLKYIVPINTREVANIAAQFHPVWHRLSQGAQKLMCRNVTIMLGEGLNDPVDMVICWTPGAKITGGTGQALRMAEHYQIPVFNLADQSSWSKLDEFVK